MNASLLMTTTTEKYCSAPGSLSEHPRLWVLGILHLPLSPRSQFAKPERSSWDWRITYQRTQHAFNHLYQQQYINMFRAAIIIILMNAFYSFPPEAKAQTIQSLTPPATTGGMSLVQALSKRRSVRSYTDVSLTETEVSQLLWSAQGVTDGRGHRTAPSAGAKYPLEVSKFSS